MLIIDIFILSCFLGYFAIWRVTPTLHAALMSMTNAISGIVIIGAIKAFNEITAYPEPYLLYFAIFLASFNIFGGFYITTRMLNMFKPKEKKHD
jgi:NAD(P) transhydrogenase subunit alpha